MSFILAHSLSIVAMRLRMLTIICESAIGYCIPARTVSMDKDIRPRAIAQTASNTLRRAMLHSSWTLLGMGYLSIDTSNGECVPS